MGRGASLSAPPPSLRARQIKGPFLFFAENAKSQAVTYLKLPPLSLDFHRLRSQYEFVHKPFPI